MSAFVNLAGKRFGRLTAIERSGSYRSHVVWRCRCDCGTVLNVIGNNMRRGNTSSCGCLKSEMDLIRHRTHGLYHTPEHGVWNAMIQRCTNPNNKDFKYYGGRGIRVCERWRTSFVAFMEDMGRRPFARAEIDRIDNDGNYAASNCRWADDFQQAENKGRRK